MLAVGQKLRCASGRTVQIERAFPAGGQGCAYAVQDSKGAPGVVKLFHARFDRAETQRRLEHLIAQRLERACPVLVPPRDLVVEPAGVGYLAELFPGEPLEEFLGRSTTTLIDSLTLAVALAHAFAVLHARGIAHGDIHGSNVLVRRVGEALETAVIDFDNFAAAGVSPPPMVGQLLYLAPELRQALAASRPAVPDDRSDRFALGVLMHEVVLLLHPASGADATPELFERAMTSGWIHDPARAGRPHGAGGVPPQVLNPDLQRLFRTSLSQDPAERPSAAAWERALLRALRSIHVCDRCTMPFLVDTSKTACPACAAAFDDYDLRLLDGRRIPVGGAAVPVGRALLGGSNKVSGTHAIFRKIGPELFVESLGRNGTFRSSGSAWVRLPDRMPILLFPGDRLRLGDVEVVVAIAAKVRGAA